MRTAAWTLGSAILLLTLAPLSTATHLSDQSNCFDSVGPVDLVCSGVWGESSELCAAEAQVLTLHAHLVCYEDNANGIDRVCIYTYDDTAGTRPTHEERCRTL